MKQDMEICLWHKPWGDGVVQSLNHVWLLWPHRLSRMRLPCLSLSPKTFSDSIPLTQWCCLTISFSVTPSPLLSIFPASGSFPVSQLFASRDRSIGVSASTSGLPVNMQGLFPLGLTSLISLPSKGLSRLTSSTTIWKHQFFNAQLSLWSNSHIRTWLLGKL